MVFTLASAMILGQKTPNTDSNKDRGYIAAKFSTPEGGVTIYLPNDIAPGDRISGTLFVDSKADSLRDITVSIGDVQGTQKDPKSMQRYWNIPTNARDGWPLIVRNKIGRQIGAMRLPVFPSPGGLDAYTFPSFVQLGRPAVIWGPFDGDMSNTKLILKGSSVSLLAESPRSIVYYVPYDTGLGATTATVIENNKQAKGDLRAIGIELTSLKSSLKKNETTTVSIKVEGIAGLNEATVPFVRVQNLTPDIIDLDGQEIHVLIPKASPQGTYQKDFKVISKANGSFLITTFVEPGQGKAVVPMPAG